jgi:hypothetical protein
VIFGFIVCVRAFVRVIESFVVGVGKGVMVGVLGGTFVGIFDGINIGAGVFVGMAITCRTGSVKSL